MPASFRGLAAATILASSALAATPVLAQDSASGLGVTLSGSATVVSDYRFRGVSRSGGDPALQGDITASHDSGFYVGTWASSTEDAGSDLLGDVELDLFGGWSGDVAEGVGLDVGLLYYAFPGNAAGADAEYFEPYATLSTTLGPVQARLGVNYAWEQDSLGGGDNLYVHTEVGAGIPNTPVTVFGRLGYTDGVLAPPLFAGTGDRTGLDWSLGARAVRGALSLGVSYVGAQGPAIEGLTDDTIVVSLGARF